LSTTGINAKKKTLDRLFDKNVIAKTKIGRKHEDSNNYNELLSMVML
jgi:hypothetical protein